MDNEKVLVAYATTSGSTQEIATYIAQELSRLGIDAETRPCREVPSVAGYTAIILGAPLYMFHLHRDAPRFLKRFKQQIEALPLAVFAGGPFGESTAEDIAKIRANLDAELAKISWLDPVSIHLVGGKFDSAQLRFPYNLIPALKQLPPSDLRDWEDIRAWTDALPAMLTRSEAAPAG